MADHENWIKGGGDESARGQQSYNDGIRRSVEMRAERANRLAAATELYRGLCAWLADLPPEEGALPEADGLAKQIPRMSYKKHGSA